MNVKVVNRLKWVWLEAASTKLWFLLKYFVQAARKVIILNPGLRTLGPLTENN